jgi:hypothetical protein
MANPGGFDTYPGFAPPTPQMKHICPVCFKPGCSYHHPDEVKAKLRKMHEAWLDAWLDDKPNGDEA